MRRKLKRSLRGLVADVGILVGLGFLLWLFLAVVQSSNPLLAAEPGRQILDVWFSQDPNSRAFTETWNTDPAFRRSIESIYDVRFLDACKVPEAAVKRGVFQTPCFEVRGMRGKLFGFRGRDVLLSELRCPRLETPPPSTASPAAGSSPPPEAAPAAPPVVASPAARLIPDPDLLVLNAKLDSFGRQISEQSRRLQEPPRLDATPIVDQVSQRFEESLKRHTAAVAGKLEQNRGETTTGLGLVLDVVKGISSSAASHGGGAVGGGVLSAAGKIFGLAFSTTNIGAAIAAAAGIGSGGSLAIVWGVLGLVRWIRKRRQAKAGRVTPQSFPPPMPAAPTIVDRPILNPRTEFTPVPSDLHAEAWRFASDQIGRQHPGATGTVEKLQSLIDQFLSSKAVTNAKRN